MVMAPLEQSRKRSAPGNLKQRPAKKPRSQSSSDLEQKVKDLDQEKCIQFSDLPLSEATASGLEASHFKTLTDIQRRAIPLALQGHDVLGAAKTGSGKTLAFLIPVLENLYRSKWTEFDGLGALIISPTRELAIQIFEVLRKIGRHHAFSAGLLVGGKSLEEEQNRLSRMNILVCTPGRMLQHLDQTAAFQVEDLKMLILDEADRVMDIGFESTVNGIIEHLPKNRQTMLFSATQTKKVSDLARLSLKDPEYVSVHEAHSSATPAGLQQNYIVTPLPEKLDTLWSFLRTNTKSKILVFLSSGKQVRFVYESFRHMQPGISLLHLYGRQKQSARLDITTRFSSMKHACLIATDVVARGLDFPAVDWVIQVDCPEDADTYIHRVGRTARYERDGRAVLFLEPSEEEGMLRRLEQKRVKIEKIGVKQKKQQSIQTQLQNMCFKDPELKYLGQKAFISYVKSIHLQKDKEVFKLSELALENYAAALGLPGAPRIKFQRGDEAKTLKNRSRQLQTSSDDEDDQRNKVKATEEVKTKYDRMFERRNHGVLSDHYSKLAGATEEDETPFLTPKPPEADSSPLETNGSYHQTSTNSTAENGTELPFPIDSNRRAKILKSKKALLKYKGKGTKLVFDDEGEAHPIYELEDEQKFRQRGDPGKQREKYVTDEGQRLKAVDPSDKLAMKAKRKEKMEKRKQREKEERDEEGDGMGEGRQAVLVPYEEPEDQSEPKESTPVPQSPPSASSLPSMKKRKRHKLEEKGNLEDLEAMASGLLE